MREHPLRHELIEEIHARTYNDFSGRGRFIRYIYLTPDGDQKIMDYVNKFLSSHGHPSAKTDGSFCGLIWMVMH